MRLNAHRFMPRAFPFFFCSAVFFFCLGVRDIYFAEKPTCMSTNAISMLRQLCRLQVRAPALCFWEERLRERAKNRVSRHARQRESGVAEHGVEDALQLDVVGYS
jgi:hypothetical protein